MKKFRANFLKNIEKRHHNIWEFTALVACIFGIVILFSRILLLF